MRMFTKKVCLFALSVLLGNHLFAQNYFTAVSPSVTNQAAQAQVAKKVSKLGLFSLDEVSMRKHLLVAPMEFHNNGKFVPLQVPLPDGTVETFNMVESPVLSAEIAAQNPEIKTYTGNGTTDRTRIIRLSLTSSGFNAVILNVNGDAVYFEPYSKTQPNVYYNYFTRDAVVPANFSSGSRCGTLPNGNTPLALPERVSPITPMNGGAITNGTVSPTTTGAALRTFRLAFAADGEFVAQNGGTVTSGFNAVVAYVNRIKAFYRNELSADFTLVSGTNLIYTNAATDPYNNDDQVAMLGQNISTLNTVLGNANYDIGHVWGYTGGSGGGIAYSPSLGVNSIKGGGVSGEGDLTSYAQVFMDQLVFHEMGHQFGMSHSYNSVIPVCTTRSQPNSMEPGSGATIMSYGFTCDTDDYYDSTNVAGQKIGPFLNFHNVSYRQAVTYMATIPAIGVTTVTGNTAPVITMPANYTIPISTPFALTASATDVNGDALTYSWEGAVTGTSSPPDANTLANTALPPYSRSYPPVISGTRTFPRLDSILSGANYAKGDKLPSVSVTDSLTFTVRDNNASGGGVAYGYEIITVDANQSPLLITNDLSGSVSGLSPQIITWSVNLASTLATPLVKISLSTDGGLTFPTTLLATTPNIGTAPVIIPNISTSQARIKVEAVNNIFFDISNNNFTITSILPVTLTSFTASLQNKKDALLKWETATETNSKGYEIEMAEGSSLAFADISFVAAKGTTTTVSDYSFIAPNLTPGVYYFRLKMIDIDGSFTYSAVQTITVVGDKGLISIYPTPVHDQLTVILSTEMQNAQLQLVNSLGQTMFVNATTNGSARLLNMGNLPAGLYLLKVMNGTNVVTTQKVVKQ